MTGEVDEEGVVGLGVANEPLHGPEDVRLGRETHWILLVVGEDDHIFSAVAKALVQERRHVADIVDAALERVWLPEVVNADQ